MSHIIARCYTGAIDLYHGIPDLLGAKIVDIQYNRYDDDYQTTLILENEDGKTHQITIAKA